jgi:signal transduction histidine kinase
MVESTVFFCCAEALQNATKHAGPGTSVTVRLSHADGWGLFSVGDDGVGFDPQTVARGRGLDNMADRLTAVGGSVARIRRGRSPARGDGTGFFRGKTARSTSRVWQRRYQAWLMGSSRAFS